MAIIPQPTRTYPNLHAARRRPKLLAFLAFAALVVGIGCALGFVSAAGMPMGEPAERQGAR